MSRFVAITALILACALTIARADVYRWVDAQGVPHYSDEWQPGSVLIKTTRPHPESGQAPSGPSASATNNRISEELTDQDNARAMQQDKAKADAALCKAAQDRYMKAIEARRVYKTNANGEREFMSDEEADAYRGQARKDVQERCGSVPEFKPDQAIPEPQPIPEPQVKPQEATSPPT